MVATLTAVFMFSALAIHLPVPSGDVVGKYTGRVYADESSIPSNVRGSDRENYRKDVAKLAGTRASLELLRKGTFKMKYSGGGLKKPNESLGTWTLKGGMVNLKATLANGKKLPRPFDVQLQVAKNDMLVLDKPYGGNSRIVFTRTPR